MTAASIARQTRFLQKRIAAQLSGKRRGPDIGDDRKVPHRNSYEVGTSKASPWRRVGDGSVAQGLIHREALMAVADELHHKGWEENPASKVREARCAHEALSRELDAIVERPGSAPIGRAAWIRQELSRLSAILDRARDRLRRVDLKVLAALLRHLDFKTGQLFPSHERIAEVASCSRGSVINALKRLKVHGIVDWVRRTVRTGAPGTFGPQLEQTSNGYFFDHRRMMPARVFARYVQLLAAKLRRLGFTPPAIAAKGAAPDDPALGAALSGLERAIASFEAQPRNAST